ncbi:MAG: hypothetical protein QOJ64_4202 [Acidobacteriota bacterium]|jgi:hypothetical protein|nr:hypothetical protein [Acidobacteriota bacterium]
MNNGKRPNGWLAFELGVLRRLKFNSASIPFVGEPELGVSLKRWGVRVAANDLEKWAATKATAFIENNIVRLDESEVAQVLEDAYVPRHKLYNPALLKWFNETDSWWFDNVRQNAEKLESPISRAIALSLGMMVGDYARSFTNETRELRQPLSQVFRRIWSAHMPPFDNSKANSSDNREARDFVAEQQTNLLFLRLPSGAGSVDQDRNSPAAWREEWIRGGDGFWDELKKARMGRLGMGVATRQQYLRFVEDILRVALHVPVWAIAHVEDGFVPTNDLVDTINHIRKVETIYSKDFSELTGLRATIITAS